MARGGQDLSLLLHVSFSISLALFFILVVAGSELPERAVAGRGELGGRGGEDHPLLLPYVRLPARLDLLLPSHRYQVRRLYLNILKTYYGLETLIDTGPCKGFSLEGRLDYHKMK